MLEFFLISILAFSMVVQSMDAAHNDTTLLLGKRSNLTYDDAIDYEKNAMLFSRDFARRAGLFTKFKQKFLGKSESSRKVVSVQLRWSEARVWLAKISLGVPPHPYLVVVDTGTSLFWVAYEGGTDPLSHPVGPYMPRHGVPAFKAVVYAESVNLQRIKGIGRVIAASEVTAEQNLDHDGVLGLALSLHSRTELPTALPFVTDFLKKYSSPIFALYLGPDGPAMHIGGTDPALYTGKIEYHPITRINQLKEPQLWQLGGASIYVNGHKNVVTGAEIILDTGTWGIYGPPDQVEAVYKLIRGEEVLNGRYDLIHCHRPLPAIAIRWKKQKTWTIDPNNFNLGQPDPSKPFCEGILKKISHFETKWVLGMSAITSWYTAFDATLKIPRAGFAELKPPAYRPP